MIQKYPLKVKSPDYGARTSQTTDRQTDLPAIIQTQRSHIWLKTNEPKLPKSSNFRYMDGMTLGYPPSGMVVELEGQR